MLAHRWLLLAWVLWSAPATIDPNVPLVSATYTYNPADFQPIRGFETRAECEKAWSEAADAEITVGIKRNDRGARVWNTFVFRCLPVTIDPRKAR